MIGSDGDVLVVACPSTASLCVVGVVVCFERSVAKATGMLTVAIVQGLKKRKTAKRIVSYIVQHKDW
jgi:hypothetical protein